MILSFIVAMTDEGVIGRENKLPWHIPEDLKHFKTTTMGKPIIMGRKTFDSIGRKPLPGRENIVLTRQSDFSAGDGVKIFRELTDALQYCEKKYPGENEVFVVGGADIYKQALPLVQRLYLTIIHEKIEGDAVFPSMDWEKTFHIESQERLQSLGKGSLPFTFILANRKLP